MRDVFISVSWNKIRITYEHISLALLFRGWSMKSDTEVSVDTEEYDDDTESCSTTGVPKMFPTAAALSY
jgi:hypothetical protein